MEKITFASGNGKRRFGYGQVIGNARGTHAGGLSTGDRMFIWAAHAGELHLLGGIRVKRSGEDWAVGKSLCGPFNIVPLGGKKWQLRFQNTDAQLLRTNTPLAMQVRARRQPTAKSAELLESLLRTREQRFLGQEKDSAAREGKQRVVKLTKRERNRKLRAHLLATRGHTCEACGFDFVERYGDFAKHCVEVHHLKPISDAGQHGRTTSLKDLKVVCPNCHRALHQHTDPPNWGAFRRACKLKA